MGSKKGMEIKEVKSFRVVFTLKLTLRYQTLILHDKNSGCLLIPKNSHAFGIPPFLCATKGCPLPSQNTRPTGKQSNLLLSFKGKDNKKNVKTLKSRKNQGNLSGKQIHPAEIGHTGLVLLSGAFPAEHDALQLQVKKN